MTLSGQIDQISPPPFVKLARGAFKKENKGVKYVKFVIIENN